MLDVAPLLHVRQHMADELLQRAACKKTICRERVDPAAWVQLEKPKVVHDVTPVRNRGSLAMKKRPT